MANPPVREEILIDMTHRGVDHVESMLKNLSDMIEKLPAKATAVNGPVQRILDLLKKVNIGESLAGQSKDVFKPLQAELKNLQAMARAIKLFDETQLRGIEEEIKSVGRLSKAYQFLQKDKATVSGSYGLDSTTTRVAQRQLQDLEQALNRRKAQLAGGQGDPAKLKQETEAIEQNTEALRRH
ncbi:MAG TPA: hypothetical protein VEC99_05710, partial [Clostridia bacterium]|nr:hypothetical protein [Clostridia bacterium]